MKKKLITAFLVTTQLATASPEPVIYGTLITNNDEKITGTLRWGEQELFLSDIFNGHKIETIGIEHFTADEKKALEEHQPGPQAKIGGIQVTFKSFFGNEIKKPYYNLPFGAIAKLLIDDANSKYVATLHDGVEIIADGNANDLNDEIYVMTAEGDTKEFEIEDIKQINFSQAPVDAKRFDQGIYGTVTTKQGTYQGRFMWDKDERALTEKLDGYDEKRNDHEIKFSNIKSIERKDNKSLVTLNDGKALLLGGTNDVDSTNRGLWLYRPDTGRIEIKWEDFIEFEMNDVDVNWLTFRDYQQFNQPLSATVFLTDDSSIHVNSIAYNLNQQSGHEWLEVDINEHTHFIPFRTIKKITKLNTSAVELLLRNGDNKIAYGQRSVTRDSNGLFVMHNNRPRWIIWQDVQSIEFD